MMTIKKILIIEDNEGISTALSEVLSDMGFVIEVAVNGKDGFDHLINRIPPQLIILDLFLPIMNGAEFRKRQLQIPYLSKIPVVGMSADSFVKQRCALINIHHFLKKPFELNEIVTLINTVGSV